MRRRDRTHRTNYTHPGILADNDLAYASNQPIEFVAIVPKGKSGDARLKS
jgi:hypothetical protein